MSHSTPLKVVITPHPSCKETVALYQGLQKIYQNQLLKLKDMTKQIFPCLWFDGQAKAAADFYCSVFKNSKIISESPMVVIFELNGNKFMGLNGGPQFKFD